MNENSTAFQANHDDQKSVLKQLNVINMERMKSIRMVLERRKSPKQINEVHVNVAGDVDHQSDATTSIAAGEVDTTGTENNKKRALAEWE